MTGVEIRTRERSAMSADSQELLEKLKAELTRVEDRLGTRMTHEIEPLKREMAETSAGVRGLREDMTELRRHNSDQDVQIGRLKAAKVEAVETVTDRIVLNGKTVSMVVVAVIVFLLIVAAAVGMTPQDVRDVLL